MWRPEPPQVAEASTVQRSVDAVDATTGATEEIDSSKNDVGRRATSAAWKRAISANGTSIGLTRIGLTVLLLVLASAAVLAAGVAPLVTVPLTVALLAGMGVSGVMSLWQRRL